MYRPLVDRMLESAWSGGVGEGVGGCLPDWSGGCLPGPGGCLPGLGGVCLVPGGWVVSLVPGGSA